MKSKVKVLIVALGLTVVTVSQATVETVQSPVLPAPVVINLSTQVIQTGLSAHSKQQDNQYAIIRPCYRWPHPCD
jgi:hypothetical protein